jgi:RNA 3'-terminal phosphate cyclase (ATP)
MRVKAESAASILLVFQAVLPFLVFAGDEDGSAISITIQGGTNCSFSLSYEYLDQVLAPALERFGIKIERKLEFRGWSHGTPQVGSAKFIISPLRPGQALRNPNWPTEQGVITKIDVSILVPRGIQDTLKAALLFELNLVFPEVVVDFILVENSGHNARLYTLLVAHTSTGLRFGRDWLYDEKIKNKTYDQLAVEISQKVVDDLDNEIRKRGVVDEHLQDQLIIFQALSQGRSFIAENSNSSPTRISLVDQPENLTGDGSLHTTTARWVTRQLLPQVKWANQGTICEGVGWKVPAPKFIETPSENSDISDRVVA